jgi:uncharacterized protein (TIGR00369 family)
MADMAFKAPNPDFAAVVAESFARQGFLETIGAELAGVRPGEVDLRFAAGPHLTQQHGFVHAGVATTVADTACGYAALSLAPAGFDVLSIEFKMNFLAPAKSPDYLCTARVVKPGRSITVCEAEVFGLDGDDGGARSLVSKMQATMMLIPGRGGG